MVLAKEKSGLYYVLKETFCDVQVAKDTSCVVAAHAKRISSFISNLQSSRTELWHYRLGHLSFDTMKHIGLPYSANKSTSICQVCPGAKLRR